ncbi:hypothetical protein EDB19DRAFT_324209 [Suillus lakei]|nr:hypothetical protein EDB19DRAFT_324209 [Suillus lakei]
MCDTLLVRVPRLYPILGGKHWQDLHYLPAGIEPLSEHETRQFMRHAARVRVLRITTTQHFNLLTVLEAAETYLFPGLWSLSFSWIDVRHVQFLPSPGLRRLSVPTLSSDIRYIIARCAALEDLFIDGSYHDTAEMSLMSDVVRSCKRLVNLSCNAPLEWAEWKHLSNTPTLLRVAIEGRFLPPLNHYFKFAPFLKLMALSFSANTAADITTMIEHSAFHSLKSSQCKSMFWLWQMPSSCFVHCHSVKHSDPQTY